VVSRALLIAVSVVAFGVAVCACWSATSLPATVKGSQTAILSDVRCASQNQSVTVTGTVTAHAAISVPPHVEVSLFAVVAARIYDSAGTQIGRNKWSASALRQGHSRQFDIKAETSGNPARCLVTSATGLD